MTVGIKYCGGCNPRYDRTALAEKIKKVYNSASYHYFSEEEDYDAVIVLHGCSARCTDLSKIRKDIPRFAIDFRSTWEKIADGMEELLNVRE